MSKLTKGQKKKKARGLCVVPYCRKKALKNRNKCWVHTTKAWKNDNPIKNAYSNLRGNAKRRGKEFTITLEQFEEFCTKTEYISLRGRSKQGYHIDRIEEDEGYHIWNIQAIPNSDNIKKYHNYNRENGKHSAITVKENKQDENEDLPF